jgi:hypothetical protein
MNCVIGRAGLLILTGLAATPSRAADLATTTMPPEAVQGTAGSWTFAVSPYLWPAGLARS